MNAIQLKERIDFYNDRSRSGRFPRYNYDQSVMDVVRVYIEDRIGKKKTPQRYSFESIQQVRDELYTLINVQNGAPTLVGSIANQYFTHQKSTITFPADYYFFVQLANTINGYDDYTRPTTYNELGPLLSDSFRHPSNTKTYYVENSTGLDIYWGVSGTFSASTLTYIRRPASFTIGTDVQLINAGSGVLTNPTVYIATEVSVHNAITYQPGDQFTSANTNLTSGQVILATNTVALDLPLKAHEEIALLASERMMGAISDFYKANFSQSETTKD